MKRAIFFLTVTFLTNLVGMYYGLYDFWWFDISLHFLGGFFMAMLFGFYFVNTKFSSERECWLAIVGAVTFIGVMWELAEYTAAQTLIEPLYDNFGFRAYFIGDMDDTIKDLLMDVFGAFAWLILFKKSIRNCVLSLFRSVLL